MTLVLRWGLPAAVVVACVGYLIYSASGGATEYYLTVSEPRWMRQVLSEVGRYGKPIYITENGIATADDAQREKYLKDTLGEVHAAIEDGADVRGYFHWSNTDNFEWARGYAAHFGLIGVDRKTLERTVKPSGRLYARIATANGLD